MARIVFAVLIQFVCVISCVTAKNKAAARYEIDAKRIDVLPSDKDALPRSREFIRLDSTYYVGWMYEGIYKYERAVDYLGYRNAIPALQKSMDLLEKDFKGPLKNLYTSFLYYNQYGSRYNDLFVIYHALKECYNNIEMPDSVMMLIDRIDKYHFQRDFFGIYHDRAWTYHRNRFYTSDKFSFLKNSVEENEKMAFYWCSKGLEFIKKNKDKNDYWYGYFQSEDDNLTIYHYLAILYNYNQNYDSSEYYYKKLEEGNRILWGNYANMQHEIGNLKNAVDYYLKPQYLRKHGLNESYYYIPSLYIYGGKTKDAIDFAKDKISQNSSLPGFGWYTIALARSYLYDGQLDSSEFFLNKAWNFKELHIGTTLTQSQYEFTINLLKVQLLDRKIDRVKFLNRKWWYTFSDLYDIVVFKIEKLMTEYVVVNELSKNSERKRIVYDLFCGESTITYDETMYLLKDFSLPYFQKKYEAYQSSDKRKNVQKYFKLFHARLKLEGGDEIAAGKEGEELLKSINSDGIGSNTLDTAHEKLFMGRLYELLANVYEKEEDQSKFELYRDGFYNEYPQLIPFSGIRMKMKLNAVGVSDLITKTILEDLKNCNIEWVGSHEENIPVANIQFVKKGKMYQAIINVNIGNRILNNEQLIFKDFKNIGKEIAMLLFRKSSSVNYN